MLGLRRDSLMGILDLSVTCMPRLPGVVSCKTRTINVEGWLRIVPITSRGTRSD